MRHLLLSRSRAIAIALPGLIVAAGLAAVAGCADPAAIAEGEDQELIAGTCKVTIQKTGKAMTATQMKALKDPVAELVLLAAGGCPTSFDEIQAKLRKTDTVNCKNDPAAPPAGTATRFVTERGQVLKRADSFRAVVSRSCNGRSNHELLMSLFGIGADPAKLPQDVELIGFDKTAGVFNYYAREENKWTFFGSSKDLIGDGYNCDSVGACVPKAASKTRCASCHLGGGLIIKEFDSPWVHWEHNTTTVGAQELLTKHKMTLGSQKDDGAGLESTVRNGNRIWNRTRVDFLKTKGVAELLRPLFCTVDLNLQSGSTSTDTVPSSVRGDFLLEPRLSSFDSVPIDSADYTALAAANGQAVKDSSKTPLKDKDGKAVTDTIFAWTYPERGQADMDYVNALVEKNVIDDDFANDILSIDFTRPIFSGKRCALLAHAPTLAAAAMTPQGIRDGFKAKLTAAATKTPELTALLAKLGDVADTAKHKDAATKYLTACKARPKKEFLADALAWSGQLRRQTHKSVGLVEFAEAMVSDKFDAATTDFRTFDPVTCTLK